MTKKTKFETFYQKDLIYNQEQATIKLFVSDLKLKLKEFKGAVKRASVATPILSVIGLWLPVITSDFKNIFSYDSSLVKGVYIGVAIIINIYVTWRFVLILYV